MTVKDNRMNIDNPQTLNGQYFISIIISDLEGSTTSKFKVMVSGNNVY